MMHYHTNSHTPGYLPDGDVETFDNEQDAINSIVSDLINYSEEPFMWMEEGEPYPYYISGIGRYTDLEAHEVDGALRNLLMHNCGYIRVNDTTKTYDLGYAFEYYPCEETRCAPDEKKEET